MSTLQRMQWQTATGACAESCTKTCASGIDRAHRLMPFSNGRGSTSVAELAKTRRRTQNCTSVVQSVGLILLLIAYDYHMRDRPDRFRLEVFFE